MKKTKKLLALVMTLVFSICLFTACGNKSDEEQKPTLNKEDAVKEAQHYLDNVVENNFELVSKATMTMDSGNKEDFYSNVISEILDRINFVPSNIIPQLENSLIHEFDGLYEDVSYSIIDATVNGDTATVEFVLEAPDVGHYTMLNMMYESVLEYYPKDMDIDDYYMGAFSMTLHDFKNSGIDPGRGKVRGTLTLQYVNGNIEVVNAEGEYEG